MWFSFYSHTRQGRSKKKKLRGANYNSGVKKKFQLLLLYSYKGGAFPCPAPASPPSATDTRDLFLIANKKILFCESKVDYCTKIFPLLKCAHGES